MNKFTMAMAALLLAACGSQNTDKSNPSATSAMSGNLYQTISGHYADTLPCSDCRGLYTEIRLRPDSTYDYVERKIGDDGRPQKARSERGIYSIEADQVKIKLTPRVDSLPQRSLEISGDDLIASWVQASANNDGKLMRKDKIIGKKGNHYVAHAVAPFTRYPVPVFMDLPATGITIQKNYLDQASEAEKAIVAYIALHYKGGCDGGSCALPEALNMTDVQMQDLVRKWMPALSGAQAAPDRTTQPTLAMLFLIRNADVMQVNVNFMDSEKKIAHETLRFKISDTQIEQLATAPAPAGNTPTTPRTRPQGHTRGQ